MFTKKYKNFSYLQEEISCNKNDDDKNFEIRNKKNFEIG